MGVLIDNYEIARMALVVSGKYIRHNDYESLENMLHIVMELRKNFLILL